MQAHAARFKARSAKAEEQKTDENAVAAAVKSLPQKWREVAGAYFDTTQKFWSRIAQTVFREPNNNGLTKAAQYVDTVTTQVMEACGVKLHGPFPPELAIFFGGALGSLIGDSVAKNKGGKGTELPSFESFEQLGNVFAMASYCVALGTIDNAKRQESGIVVPKKPDITHR